jgi:regulator of replication initiation timing
MHRHYFARLGLCAPADDTPAPTSGAPAAVPSAEPIVQTPQATAPPVKPGVIDSALAMVRDKGAMVAEINTLKTTNGTLLAENTNLKAQLTAVTAERDNLQDGFTRLEAALSTAEKEKTTVQTEVTHQLAAAGVPDSALPKAPAAVVTTNTEDQIAALNKQIDETKDPRQKGVRANQVWDLMTKNKVQFSAN